MVKSEHIIALFEDAEIRVPGHGLRDDELLVTQGLDSMDLVTLLHQVEVKFDVVISTEQTARLRRLKDIVEFLNTEGVAAPARP